MFYNIPKDKFETFSQSLNCIIDLYNGQAFAADMLIALSRNMSFCLDKKLESSFISTARTDQEKSLLWRLHVLTWAASNALHVAGDFVECGVFQGFSSAVVCKYLNFESRENVFYLYDTFAGLPEETSTQEERMGMHHDSYDSESLFAYVKNVFQPIQMSALLRVLFPILLLKKYQIKFHTCTLI